VRITAGDFPLMKTTLVLAMTLSSLGANLFAQEASAPGKVQTKRVAFAQSCFWTGEMKLGQIEGVVRTEAGFFKGREVTLVEYAPGQVSLEDLAAAQDKRASLIPCILMPECNARRRVLRTARRSIRSYRPSAM